VEAAADVVVGDGPAHADAAGGNAEAARDGDHRGRLRGGDGDVALGVDVRVRGDMGVEVVGDRVDRHRAAYRRRISTRRAHRDSPPAAPTVTVPRTGEETLDTSSWPWVLPDDPSRAAAMLFWIRS